MSTPIHHGCIGLDPDDRHRRAAIEVALLGVVTQEVLLGRYQLLNRLGAGGIGIAYAAYEVGLASHRLRRLQIFSFSTSSCDPSRLRWNHGCTAQEARAEARSSSLLLESKERR
jgi:hypothetical protein